MIFISVEKKIKLFYEKTKAQQRNLLILNTELKLPAEPGGGKKSLPLAYMQNSNLPSKNKSRSQTSIKQKILILLYFKPGNLFACNTKMLLENKAVGGGGEKIVSQK